MPEYRNPRLPEGINNSEARPFREFLWLTLGETGLLTNLSFSREQERDADSAGLAALAAVYGHAAGALDLYRTLQEQEGSPSVLHLDFFGTHPDTGRRIEAIEAEARARGWALDGAITPFPDWLSEALESSKVSEPSSEVSTL